MAYLTGPTRFETHITFKEQIVRIQQHELWMRKQGYKPLTTRTAVCSLKALARDSDLMNPEEIKENIAYRDVCEGTSKPPRKKIPHNQDLWL
jgi:hypothetical protein